MLFLYFRHSKFLVFVEPLHLAHYTLIFLKFRCPVSGGHYRIHCIESLLEKEITKKLALVRNGSLAQAEAVVQDLENQWPYRPMIITTCQEQLRIDVYNASVGFNELDAARSILAGRKDYQLKQVMLAKQVEIQKEFERKQKISNDLSVDVQSRIVSTLETAQSNEILVESVCGIKDLVYKNAEKYNYAINNDVDYQIQAAINGLPLTNDPKEFAFHLATIDHLLHDIQMKTAQVMNVEPGVLSRTPELLERAIVKYWEYLSPTDREISCMIDLAKYVSDVTTGSTYLSPEVINQRTQQFWSRLESLSHLTPEKVIDNCMYAAARATWIMGLTEIAPLLRSIKAVSLNGVESFSAKCAQRFIHIFDRVIGNNPAIITPEGGVVLAASQEVSWWHTLLAMAWKSKPGDIKDVNGLKSFLESENNTPKISSSVQSTAVFPNGRYEDVSYHTERGNSVKSKAPVDGQKALDNSLEIVGVNSPHRIGISNGEFVILSQTSPGLFHGHVRTWDKLTIQMQNTLRRANWVNFKGKIKV